MLTTLFVSAQVALPESVRGRGLAIYLTVYFGSMTAGSAIWGKIASLESVPAALYVAAAGAFRRPRGDVGPEAADGRRTRPLAGHALAHAGVRAARSRRSGADSGHRRIPGRPGGAEQTIPRSAETGDRLRTQARRRLCMGSLRGRAARSGAAWSRPSSSLSLLELKHLRARVTEADRLIEDQSRAFLPSRRKSLSSSRRDAAAGSGASGRRLSPRGRSWNPRARNEVVNSTTSRRRPARCACGQARVQAPRRKCRQTIIMGRSPVSEGAG